MAEFVQYFPQVFEPANLKTFVRGIFGDLISGATPGFGPAMAVALLVSFLSHIDFVTGLIVPGVAYITMIAGGAMSAALINISGVSVNITRLFNGHVLACQRKSRTTLSICSFSSLVGRSTDGKGGGDREIFVLTAS